MRTANRAANRAANRTVAKAMTDTVATAATRTLLPLVLAAALAGCGIEPTGIIDAGAPAGGLKGPGEPETDIQLYFLGPTGLRPASRPAKTQPDPQQAIDTLLAGPNAVERARGLNTALPKMDAGVKVTETPDEVKIEVPMNASSVNSAALSQLVCTAASAAVPQGRPVDSAHVVIQGGGTALAPLRCDGNNAYPAIQSSPSAPNG